MFRKCSFFGKYPCNDYLNNALRFLLDDEIPNKSAIEEICFCILKADGKIYDDVVEKMKNKGLYPWLE